MESVWYDVKLAVRSFLKKPGFLAITILTFALGIGANTAIFSVVHGVILAPLGYKDEARLQAISSVNPSEDLEFRGNFLPDFWYWRENSRTFDEMAFHGWRSWTLQEPGHVERVESVAVSANLFGMLGIQPALGRGFEPEDEIPGPGRVVLLSFSLWQRVFGGDPSVLGRSVNLDDGPVTIIGVMPADTDVPSRRAELWRPVGYLEQYEQSAFGREERDFRVIGHLAEGVGLGTSQAEMGRFAEALAESFPATNSGWEAKVQPLREHIVGDAEVPLFIAFAAVGLVLLIACTNIANLLLVRAMGREREMAVRQALGAGRRRLLQQQIVESLVLTAVGGFAGLLFAAWLSQLLLAYEPGILPRKEGIGFDVPVLLFAFAASLVIGIVFGLVSALHRVPSLSGALKQGGAQIGGSRRQNRLRMGLVGAQIAVALTLLVGAGLLVKGLHKLSRVDPGFRPDGVYASHIILGGRYRRDLEARRVYFKQLVENVRALPGVSDAALSTTPPIPGMGIKIEVPYRGAEGPLATEAGAPSAAFRVIGPGYFETIGTPLLRGRDFTDRDTQDAPPVVIINNTLAERAFPGEAPIGRQLELFLYGETMELEVIGVSADTRFAGLDQATRPAFFLVHPQMPFLGIAVVARTSLGPATYGATLRRTATALDPSQLVLRVESLEEALSGTLAMERFYSILLGLFAAVALTLAASGIYGVFAYWVRQRQREMGLRIALGASPSEIRRLVLSRGVAVTFPSLVAGLATALALSKALSSTFRGIDAVDPAVLAAAAVALGCVAMAACIVPARQAAKVQPTRALRSE
ncbi:MAG: ABC transporter permease [Acidobacteria bacterium]|nr:MAG: ABC transporter permease [Acidobacteriota bacterium]